MSFSFLFQNSLAPDCIVLFIFKDVYACMKGWSQAEIFTLGLRIAIRKISPSPPQLCLYNNFHGQENPVVKVYNSPYGASLLIIGRMKLRSSECR